VKDGAIDCKQFCTWLLDWTPAEAEFAFEQHKYLFNRYEHAGKKLDTWSEDDKNAISELFNQFDTDHSGKISASELEPLCAVLGLDPEKEEVKRLSKAGSFCATEFLTWFADCSLEEAHDLRQRTRPEICEDSRR